MILKPSSLLPFGRTPKQSTNRAPGLVVALAGLLGLGQAAAAPIELYEQPQFRGATLGLDRAAPQLGEWGFNDMASSLIVRSGRWEVCTDGEFRGACRTFGPGQYGDLPAGMVRALSSVRPAAGGSAEQPVAVQSPYGNQAALTLYRDGDQGGQALDVNGAMTSLPGFNDEASSVEIRRGRWQFCSDGGYGGSCMVLGPGRHEFTGRMHDEISSVRPVFGQGDQPLASQGGVTLYSDGSFGGRSLLITGPMESLGRFDFNDVASSVEVHGGNWEMCRNAKYGGPCFVLGPGRHVLRQDSQDSLSSLRPVSKQPTRRPVPMGSQPVGQSGIGELPVSTQPVGSRQPVSGGRNGDPPW